MAILLCDLCNYRVNLSTYQNIVWFHSLHWNGTPCREGRILPECKSYLKFAADMVANNRLCYKMSIHHELVLMVKEDLAKNILSNMSIWKKESGE